MKLSICKSDAAPLKNTLQMKKNLSGTREASASRHE